jgi:hypothetical protein
MSQPAPPDTVGLAPLNADEVNRMVGAHLRQFLAAKASINQDQDWLAPTDLKGAPYFFSPAQEADIKSAINTLDSALDGVDLTFVNRLVGLPSVSIG